MTAWLWAALAVMLVAPVAAQADGGPASDVLATQAVYVPVDGGLVPSQTAQLAAAAGHRLTPPAAVTTPKPGSALGSVDLGSWLALAAGAVLIAAAWTVSLRARPPLRRGR